MNIGRIKKYARKKLIRYILRVVKNKYLRQGLIPSSVPDWFCVLASLLLRLINFQLS